MQKDKKGTKSCTEPRRCFPDFPAPLRAGLSTILRVRTRRTRILISATGISQSVPQNVLLRFLSGTIVAPYPESPSYGSIKEYTLNHIMDS